MGNKTSKVKAKYGKRLEIEHQLVQVCEIAEQQAAKIADLEELLKVARGTLVEIEQRCDWIDRDCHEGDKVMCGTAGIRFEIAKAYPKYGR